MTYRIVQTSDATFEVERQRMVPHEDNFWPWGKKPPVETWESLHPSTMRQVGLAPFPTEAAAQKWIDDKRTYPIVVKQPA